MRPTKGEIPNVFSSSCGYVWIKEMELRVHRDIFDAISPLDHRYCASSPELWERLSAYLSEAAAIRYQARVEAALVSALARRGLCSRRAAEEVERAALEVTPEEVYREEQRTRHHVRALVNCIRARVSDEAKPFVHLTATSMDITDTARALQLRDAAREVLIPLLKELERALIAVARREAETLQAGRTHGQHAVPITFGFAMAEYVSRLGQRIEGLERAAAALKGKMAGAVGAYNASRLFFDDPAAFEREVLESLGLSAADHATQIVQPEFLLDYMHAVASTFGVLANLADDIRHLQRTEIGEVGEAFEADQVGSSTMPHKRNPWNFEHVKSLWKVFVPRMITLYMDQISEHQRDLTNSASGRFAVEMAAGLAAAADRLVRVVRKLVVDRRRMLENFESTAKSVIAEPLYILLAAAGHPDAHEAVRRLTLRAEAGEGNVWDLALASQELAPYLARLSEDQRRVLEDPRRYTGIAAERARRVCDEWERRLGL